MLGMILEKYFSFFLTPLINAEYATCGYVFAIIDKMVS